MKETIINLLITDLVIFAFSYVIEISLPCGHCKSLQTFLKVTVNCAFLLIPIFVILIIWSK